MSRDRSLEEFLGDDETDAEEDPVEPAPPDGESTDAASVEEEAGEESVERGSDEREGTGAAVTYEWTPEGRPCAACGATVRRRWRRGADGEELVCRECKSWR